MGRSVGGKRGCEAAGGGLLLELLTYPNGRFGIREKDRSERAAKEAATRKSLVGSGDRSDRIRTYNFAQGRVTDHRIGLTLYKLQAILDGDLGEIVAALQAAQAAEQLAALESGAPA